VNRRDFRRLAELRLADAQALLEIRRYAAAYYLAGYAVECGLKACIARRFGLYEFPLPPRDAAKLYVHELDKLAGHELLAGALKAQRDAVPNFAANWTIVIRWKAEARYEYRRSREEAEQLLAAITDVPDGVMEWIRQLW
jgi:hypothetical protein